ncbi:alanine racemase [Ktedonobacteria bacterium brp13]|nr:alanine racemase [Ktedonobacteria bacterium brp13]
MIYLDHLLKATQGTIYHPGKHIQFQAFSHDSRQLTPGEMFVAVHGERGNGHDYLLDAQRKGATGLLVTGRAFQQLSEQARLALTRSDLTIILVDDTRLALQSYARTILDLWHPTVIAVTGSVGKTSTKEALATVLGKQFTTFRSWQNYNDMLGIPLSLGRLEAQHEYAVLELGCDHPGEIAALCRIVRPHIGVLTNISPVQLQYFSSVTALAEEFGALLTSLPSNGHLFYNQNDSETQALLARYHEMHHYSRIVFHPLANLPTISTSTTPSTDESPSATAEITVSQQGTSYRTATTVAEESDEQDSALTQQKTGTEIVLSSQLLGAHSKATMEIAYQIALSRGIYPERAGQAITQLHPLPGRLNPLPGIHASLLLDDTHNAAPVSMIAGLQTLAALTPRRGCRIAVLGDMLNLGDYADEAHRAVGQQAAGLVDYLVTRGERASLIAEAALQAGLSSEHLVMTSTHEDAAQAVRRIIEHQEQHQRDEEVLDGITPEQGPTTLVLIKGSEEARMERVTEMLMARPWEASEKLVRQAPGWQKTFFMHAERPTWLEVDLNAIGSNTRHIKSLVAPQTRLLVALKADAYGHGALKVARTVLQNGASMLGVATVTEAIPLREANIHAPILVFGYVPRWQMREAIRLGVSVTLYSADEAHALSSAALALDKTVQVHVKVDTGMGRLGVRFEQLEEIIALMRTIIALPGLALEGLYTHFAQSDSEDRTHVHLQLARFQQVLAAVEEQGLRPPIVHAANSAAVLSLPASHFDMVRPGIAVYGLEPSTAVPLPVGFRPALSFKTQISQVKWIPEGEGISYGSTYITSQPTRIAVLPVGYADGFRRAPANWGSVLIHGQEAPLLGRICMDQCMVDVTHIPAARMGDEVVLIGRQGEASLPAEVIAERLGTSNYEVVSEILARVPRVD